MDFALIFFAIFLAIAFAVEFRSFLSVLKYKPSIRFVAFGIAVDVAIIVAIYFVYVTYLK